MSMAMVCRRTKRGDVEICTDEITLVLVHEHVACARRVAECRCLHARGPFARHDEEVPKSKNPRLVNACVVLRFV